MVRELFVRLYDLYRQFTGTGTVIVLFIVSLIVLVISKKDRCTQPAALSVLGTVGWAVSEIISSLTGISVVFAVAVCILAVTSSGTNVLAPDMNTKAENAMHIPAHLLESMDAIKDETDSACILTMPGWELYFECYSSGFAVVDDPEAQRELDKHQPDMKIIARKAHECKCDYVVISSDIWPEVPITKYGYDLVFETEGCAVYKEVMTP